MKRQYILISFLFAAFLAAIALSSCKGKNELDYEEVTIPVDMSRVDNEFVDMNLKFKFNAPKKWLLKPSELTEKIVTRQKGEKEAATRYLLKPLYVFFSDSTKGILTVATISESDSVYTPIQVQRYEDELIARYGKDNVKIKNFIKDKIMISQLSITFSSFTTRKLIMRNVDGVYLQFDYTLQNNVKNQEEKAVESSIGSLRLVK